MLYQPDARVEMLSLYATLQEQNSTVWKQHGPVPFVRNLENSYEASTKMKLKPTQVNQGGNVLAVISLLTQHIITRRKLQASSW